MPGAPRITPGGRDEIGRVNFALARLIGAATGAGPPHVFTTLARHPRLFRRWLRFASALMPGGLLPRAETELLILRTAHNCGSDYEWQQHERIGREAGLSAAEVEAVRDGPSSGALAPEQALLLRAADELHGERALSDEVWAQLRARYADAELIELCMLVGHYEMLAMTLNSLRVAPDAPPRRKPPRVLRLAQSILTRSERAEPRSNG